jgi:hypothetical protein
MKQVYGERQHRKSYEESPLNYRRKAKLLCILVYCQDIQSEVQSRQTRS